MADILKYDMTNIWASAGDVVAPDAAKINAGWGVEVVPRQWWNWFENRQDQNIAYLLQKGIPEWDATTQYIANKSYVTRSGIVYRATVTSTNSDPISLTSWVRAFADYSVSSNALGSLTPAANTMPYYTSTTAAAVTALTAFARTLLDDADAATMRTTLGAQQSNTNLTALSGVAASANALPYFTGTTAMGITTLTAFGRSLIGGNDAVAVRTLLGVDSAATATAALNTAIATRQPLSSVLTTLATVAPDTNKLPYFTGTGTADTTDLTAFARTLLDDLDSTAARATLGLGTGAVATVTTSTTDSITGRLLKVGDFGLGGLTVGIADLNVVPVTGVYGLSGASTNGPVGAGSGSTLFATVFSSVEQRQIVLYRTNPARMAIRSQVSSTWSAWAEVVTGIPTTLGRSLMDAATAAAARTLLDVYSTTESTTNLNAGLATKQPLHPNLTALASTTPSANTVFYFTSPTTVALATVTPFARSILDDADAISVRTTIDANNASNLTSGIIPQARLPIQPTTSRYDTTANALLKVGDFGVGSTATPWTVNLDTITAAGFYGYGSGTTTTGMPSGSAFGEVIHSAGDGAGTATQIALEHNSDHVWYRRRTASAWTPWVEFVTGLPSSFGRSLMDTASAATARVLLGVNASSYKNTFDVLWSGTASIGATLTLSRQLAVGDLIILKHTDAKQTLSQVSAIYDTNSGKEIVFAVGNSIQTIFAIGATLDKVSFTSFTSGIGVSAILAVRIVSA